MLLKDFIRALKFVVPAAGVQEVRHYLNGVYLEFKDCGTISLTATNGHRLHTVTMRHTHCCPDGAHIIDTASIKVWLAAVKPGRGSNPELDISVPCGVPMLHGIPAKTIEGKYPAFRHAIPTGDPRDTRSLLFDVGYLSTSVNALKLFGCKVCRTELFGDTGAVKMTPRYTTQPGITEVICLVMPVDPKRGG